MARPPVVFVHGLWLHAESWNRWLQHFRDSGYEAAAASWPGDSESTEATRKNAAALGGKGVAEIADHIAAQLKAFQQKPIVIGHSFGGMLAQNLLARDLAAAAIAIDPAPIKGVLALPISALRASFPVLRNPFNWSRAISLTEQQFRFAFANMVSPAEAKELYDTYAMPAPARPLFQAAASLVNPAAETKVDVRNGARGPLLLVAGERDNTVPPAMVKSAHKLYRRSKAVTDYKEFPARGHSLTIDHGWKEIADFAVQWLSEKGL